jgi:hypothetical protein
MRRLLPVIDHRHERIQMKQGQFLKLGTSLAIQVCLPLMCYAQVNTGSNGSDGALDFSSINYTTNIVINMADHPNGIYQYTYVNMPSGVTVTFIPNPNNTPVVWLVQSNAVIDGTVDVSGQSVIWSGGMTGATGGVGGPGGWSGGNGGTNPSPGQGPGAGNADPNGGWAGNGSYGSQGLGSLSGAIYGNSFLFPLLGGSGGGGSTGGAGGGGGGGGAILVAASNSILLNGSIIGQGGSASVGGGGGGSAGGVRLVTSSFMGTGNIYVRGGLSGNPPTTSGGAGRIRIDVLQSTFGGNFIGTFTQGSQFIILPTPGQGAQLTVTSVAGVPVSASPTGVLATPDAVLSAQQNNPIPIVVSCANLPLNTPITVSVKPANGSPVSAVGYNTTGTLASSTATISIIIPRGGGLIYATAATSN